MKVLIADDEPHIRRVVAGIVTSLGGTVVAEAGDGEEALALCERHRPEMVILDINMPRLTGEEVLARQLARAPRTVGVMMTAQDSIEVVRRCLELGAANYILKSNRAEEIYRLLADAWPEYEAQVRDARAA